LSICLFLGSVLQQCHNVSTLVEWWNFVIILPKLLFTDACISCIFNVGDKDNKGKIRYWEDIFQCLVDLMLFILNEMRTLSVKDLEHLSVTPVITIRFISRNYQCYSITVYKYEEWVCIYSHINVYDTRKCALQIHT
jgi:hypothetical protein